MSGQGPLGLISSQGQLGIGSVPMLCPTVGKEEFGTLCNGLSPLRFCNGQHDLGFQHQDGQHDMGAKQSGCEQGR